MKDKNLLIAQLGPTGGKKGYGTITGKYSIHTGILSYFLVQTIYLHYLTAPRGARGVKRTGRT